MVGVLRDRRDGGRGIRSRPLGRRPQLDDRSAPALLTLLFIGSTIFTESITASKYPAYADYQRRTSMLVPLPRRRGASEAPDRRLTARQPSRRPPDSRR